MASSKLLSVFPSAKMLPTGSTTRVTRPGWSSFKSPPKQEALSVSNPSHISHLSTNILCLGHCMFIVCHPMLTDKTDIEFHTVCMSKLIDALNTFSLCVHLFSQNSQIVLSGKYFKYTTLLFMTYTLHACLLVVTMFVLDNGPSGLKVLAK